METSEKAQPLQRIFDVAGYDAIVGDGQEDSLRLSEKEELVLQLYDQIKQLRLESSLLEAQKSPPRMYWKAIMPGTFWTHTMVDIDNDPFNIEEKTKIAERELLEAQATYSIRSKVEESVMKANPTLNAVHAPEEASIPQR